MKSTIKIIATITLVGAILIIGYFSIYFFYARDVENVKVNKYNYEAYDFSIWHTIYFFLF